MIFWRGVGRELRSEGERVMGIELRRFSKLVMGLIGIGRYIFM